jgi:hypothetical protein
MECPKCQTENLEIVKFCSERLDPEGVHQIMDGCSKLILAIICSNSKVRFLFVESPAENRMKHASDPDSRTCHQIRPCIIIGRARHRRLS